MYKPEELKAAAADITAEIRARIGSSQRGVPTFSDHYMLSLIEHLTTAESGHRWHVVAPDVPDDQYDDNQGYLRWLGGLVRRRKLGRHVSFGQRKILSSDGQISDLNDLDLVMSQGAVSCVSWKGQPLFKSVFDMALVQMMLWEVRPATVFEIGSGAGTSAVWMADLLRCFGSEAHVYSVDLVPVTSSYAGVTYLQGDCASPESLFPRDLLQTAPHPWLVIEDAHVNVANVLARLDRFVTPGDYLYIEDSRSKTAAIETFLTASAARYEVDTHYTDFFGHNATSAPDSILVAV